MCIFTSLKITNDMRVIYRIYYLTVGGKRKRVDGDFESLEAAEYRVEELLSTRGWETGEYIIKKIYVKAKD